LLRSHWARAAFASAIGGGDELACVFPYGRRGAGWRALRHAMRSAAAWPGLAIFEADHSPSPIRPRPFALALVEDRRDFLDSTSRAAVSASARSLRSRSRSSSLMRLRSAHVACGLARTSSGSASAVVQLVRHLSSSAGYTPCSRHQALGRQGTRVRQGPEAVVGISGTLRGPFGPTRSAPSYAVDSRAPKVSGLRIDLVLAPLHRIDNLLRQEAKLSELLRIDLAGFAVE
jgi:hypothetical protein